MDIAGLRKARRIESVPPDLTTARARLELAKQHLQTADLLLLNNIDLEMAYVALYDGARKAITAAMLASGVRATSRPGAHEAVAMWCTEILGGTNPAARRFDGLRRRRNRSEYADLVLGRADVELDLADARDIVAGAEAHLDASEPTRH